MKPWSLISAVFFEIIFEKGSYDKNRIVRFTTITVRNSNFPNDNPRILFSSSCFGSGKTGKTKHPQWREEQ